MTTSAFDRFLPPQKQSETTSTTRSSAVYNLIIQPDIDYYIQILNPPVSLFPNGFPVLERHWVTIDGKTRPIWCTEGMSGTNGNCLTCYLKSTGSLTSVDKFGKQTILVVPIYDFSRYRKDGSGKYIQIPPHMPVMDDSKVITGGFKYMALNESHYRALKIQNDNVSNICSSCGSSMKVVSLNCGTCDAPIYEDKQLYLLTSDQYQSLISSRIQCVVCGSDTHLLPKKVCQSCGSEKPKTLHDIVVVYKEVSTITSSGKTKRNPSFNLNPTINTLTEDELKEKGIDEFWAKLKEFSENPAPLPEQAKMLKTELPKEWLSSLTSEHATPYQQ